MSTTEVVPTIQNNNAPASSDVSFLPINLTFAAVKYTDGKLELLSEDSADKVVKDNKGEILWKQAVTAYKASNDAGVVALVPLEEERVVLFNRAALSKQKQRSVAMLSETAKDEATGVESFVWEPKAESVDLREILAEESQRRNLSPIEKAERSIDNIPGLPPEVVAAMKAMLRGQQVSQ